MEHCIFCDKTKILTDIVYEDETVLAFMDMDPVNEGHILLIPKDHYLDLDEIPDEILSRLMTVLKTIPQTNTRQFLKLSGVFVANHFCL